MNAVQIFEAVVADVDAPVQGYLRRRADQQTAEDVLGDVLLVMWRRRGDIPPEAPLPWCCGVARGCLANALRSSTRQLKLVRRLAAERLPPPAGDDPVLHEALHVLSVGEQEVLRLWAWEQLKPAEIATVLGMTPNAASLRLHRATMKLKKELLRRQDPGPSGQPVERQGEETR